MDISPQHSDFRDSTYTYTDADVVLGLMCPANLDMVEYLDYDVRTLGKNMITVKVIKNRYEESNVTIPLIVNPQAGMFAELPKVGTPELDGVYRYFHSLNR